MNNWDIIKAMIIIAIALAVVLHVLHFRVIQNWHGAIFHNPMISATTWAVRRHLKHECADCSMVAELVLARVHGQGRG